MCSIEHLLSTRDFQGEALLNSMQLTEDVLVINQLVHSKAKHEKKLPHENFYTAHNSRVRVLSYAEKGIGISRKRALQEGRGDILLFTDDDMVYKKDYAQLVRETFRAHPQADLFMFKVERLAQKERPEAKQSRGVRKLSWYNSLRYGAINIAIKRAFVEKTGISFDERFGSNLFLSGEDSVFIADALAAGAQIYSSSEPIARVDMSQSSWFSGYTEDFLKNRGAIFYRINPRYYKFLCLQFALRKKHLFDASFSISRMMKCMDEGKHLFIETFGELK
ncbi:MAG: glycosyltransferase family 2 protein [Coriobacteriia bacterium]|nr:glycosyltransferase family 2 protein [Coriobacteriia bacterium]